MSLASILLVLVVGVLLLLAEVTVIPGVGIAGGLGLLALVSGAIAAYTELGPEWGAGTGLASLGIVFALLYVFPKTRAGQRLVLEDDQTDAISQPHRDDLLAALGKTVTPLRPTGRARFGREEVDVVSDGEYINADRSVKVVAVEGVRVVVIEIPPHTQTKPSS